MAADNPLDLQVLKSLIGDDIDLQREILHVFCNSADSFCDELDLAYSSNSSEAVKAAAHKLKSSAQTVGARVLGQLCEQLEVAGRDRSWETIEVNYPEIRTELKSISAFVQRLIE